MPRRSLRPPIRRTLLALAAAVGLAVAGVAALWATLPDPAPLARENPRTTALIEQRRAEARAKGRVLRVRQTWVSLDRVSKRMLDAIILSEDAKFFGHDGIDWEAIRLAAEHDLKKGRFARGASTITQQLAKNLWFGTEKSLARKVKEAVLASKLERALSKRRILAIYLNVAELGDGVFGVEAGARARFGTSAASLSAAQAAVLASTFPAPRRVDLARPSTWLQRRSRRLLERMRDAGRLSAEEYRVARGELEGILAGPRPADDREEPPEEDAAAEETPVATGGSGPSGSADSVSREPSASADRPSQDPSAGAEGGSPGSSAGAEAGAPSGGSPDAGAPIPTAPEPSPPVDAAAARP